MNKNEYPRDRIYYPTGKAGGTPMHIADIYRYNEDCKAALFSAGFPVKFIKEWQFMTDLNLLKDHLIVTDDIKVSIAITLLGWANADIAGFNCGGRYSPYFSYAKQQAIDTLVIERCESQAKITKHQEEIDKIITINTDNCKYQDAGLIFIKKRMLLASASVSVTEFINCYNEYNLRLSELDTLTYRNTEIIELEHLILTFNKKIEKISGQITEIILSELGANLVSFI